MGHKTWRSKLSKAELKHLKEMEIKDKAGLERTFADQAKSRKLFPKIEPCWECKFIARKLGFEV